MVNEAHTNAQNGKKLAAGDYSKIYQIRPQGNRENPHLSKFLLNPLEPQEKQSSNQATPAKLVLAASPVNPVGNLSSLARLNLSSLFVRQETQHMQRMHSGIYDMGQLMQSVNMNEGQAGAGNEGNAAAAPGALSQVDKEKMGDMLGNISANIRKNMAQIPKDFGDSNFSLKNI